MKNKKYKSFEDFLDAKYGVFGTKKRMEFEIKAIMMEGLTETQIKTGK